MTEQPAVAKALADQEVRRIAREAAHYAVEETFTAMGLKVSDPDAIIEAQQDFAWLRGRRILERKIRVKVIITLFTVLIVGVVGAAATIWAIAAGRSGP